MKNTLIGLAVAVLVFVATSSAQAAGIDLCQGLITDKAAHPMTSLAKPALGQAVTDPQFGTKIRRVSAIATSEGDNAIIVPMYGTMPAWNADESKLILYHVGKGHELYDGTTYAFIRSLPINPSDVEHVQWDANDPDVLYYPEGKTLKKYSVASNTSSVLHSFASICSSNVSMGNDPQYMSWSAPVKTIGLQCGNTKFIYNIANDSTSTAKTFSTGNVPIVGPSGALVFLAGKVYDTSLNLLRTLAMANSDEHASIGRDANGNDVYNTVSFDDADPGALVSYTLSSGARKVIIGPKTGWTYPPSGIHVSSVALKNPGWAAVSIVGNTADGKAVLDNELVLTNVTTGAVCRVAHHRSKAGEGPWDYWAEPHVVISPSGTRLLFGSDWGGGASVDSYVVELPSYGGTIPPPPTATPTPTGTPTTTTPPPPPPNLYGFTEGDVVSSHGVDGDPDIFIVNRFAYKRLFVNPEIFNLYGHLGFAKVKTITPAIKNSFGTSGLFRNCETNDQKVWGLEVQTEDVAVLHHVQVGGDQAVQQDPNFFKKVFCINSREEALYPKSPVAYTSLNQLPHYAR